MADRATILVLIKGLGIGGAEKLIVNSIPHLDRDRFAYEVAYLLPWKDDFVGAFANADLPVHQLGGARGSAIRSIGELRRLVTDRSVDLIDAHLPVTGVVARMAKALGPRVPVVYHEHSLSVQRRLSSLRFVSFAANVSTYWLADQIVAVSENTAHDVRRFNFGRTPIKTIINGIPLPARPADDQINAALEAVGVPRGHRVVGHVAKMVSKKQQSDLLRAAALVLQHHPNTVFVLIGQGPMRESLMKLADELGLAERVLFPGFVEDLVSLEAGFDVFALSSLHEGLPTVVIEATSLGVPVVATAVGGTPEVIDDGHSGILVPPGRPEQLAEAISRLLEDEDLRRTMGQAAIKQAARFDIARRVREIEATYNHILNRDGVCE